MILISIMILTIKLFMRATHKLLRCRKERERERERDREKEKELKEIK